MCPFKLVLTSECLSYKVRFLANLAAVPMLFPIASVLLAAEPDERTTSIQSTCEMGGQRRTRRLRPPIREGISGAAGDGGTVFVELVDADNRRLTLSVSQHTWENVVPPDTLFLHVANPFDENDRREGRLPVSVDEVEEVLDLLRLATKDTDQDDISLAKSALERLQRRRSHAIRDPSAGTEPQWYRAYEAERRRRRTVALLDGARTARFLGCFPADAHDLLEPSSGDALTNEDIRARAEKLKSVFFGDPIDLLVATFHAFGVKAEDKWRTLDESDLVLFEALRTSELEDFAVSLSRVENDNEGMLGACRVLFDPNLSYASRLDETEYKLWVPRVARIALSVGPDCNKQSVIDSIAENKGPVATLLLRSIISDNSLRQQDSSPISNQEIGLRETACLALALRNDVSVRPSTP